MSALAPTDPDWMPGFKELLALSEFMLAQAEAELWPAVAQLEARRQELLKVLFGQPVPAEVAQAVAGDLRRILDINSRVVALGETVRDAVARELAGLATARRAHQAYGEAP